MSTLQFGEVGSLLGSDAAIPKGTSGGGERLIVFSPIPEPKGPCCSDAEDLCQLPISTSLQAEATLDTLACLEGKLTMGPACSKIAGVNDNRLGGSATRFGVGDELPKR